MKRLIVVLPFILLSLSFMPSPISAPWNEEETDSLGNVVTAHSLGEFHSSVHYDLTKLLALKMGFSIDTSEMMARYCALVDQINPKPGYPYSVALNSISIPDTFPGWDESLAGTERGGMYQNAQNELNAQYWHFAFRDPDDTITGQMVWGDYPAAGNFSYYTGPPYFWRVPITFNLHHIMNWALYNGGDPGLPDQLTPAEVMYCDALSNGYQLVEPNSIQSFGIFLHALADSYSHEECMVNDTLRSHPANDPYCGLTYHTEHEYAYDTAMRAKEHADSMFHAMWRALREYKRVHVIAAPALWTSDNNGFQDGDGIPDNLEDDGDTVFTESFLELWKNPATSDLNSDGVIDHSDHTTWRILVCNNEMDLPQQPGSISGPDQLCEGATVTYSIAPVPGALEYSWTIPGDCTGQSDSTSIVVTAGNTSGTISVHAIGQNGSGPSRFKVVSVTPLPLQTNLVNINVLFNQNQCSHARETITVAGNNTTYVVRNGGSATMIAGQHIIYSPGTKVISGGYLLGYISANECCLGLPVQQKIAESTKSGQSVRLTFNSAEEPVQPSIFPNPTTGKFRVLMPGSEESKPVGVEIFNMWGEAIARGEFTHSKDSEFSLEDQQPGLFLVKIICEGRSWMLKLVKQG
jgi:hypothetical protein